MVGFEHVTVVRHNSKGKKQTKNKKQRENIFFIQINLKILKNKNQG